MNTPEIDNCCDLGLKDSCVTCEFTHVCNGKWSHSKPQDARPEDELHSGI